MFKRFHHLILLVLQIQNLRYFLCIPAPVADAAAVNPNGISLSANGLITLFINGNPFFNNGPMILPRNPPYCIILDN